MEQKNEKENNEPKAAPAVKPACCGASSLSGCNFCRPLVYLLLIAAIALLAYQFLTKKEADNNIPPPPVKTEPRTGVGKAIATLNSVEERAAALALTQFFSLLTNGAYDEAVALFSPDQDGLASIGSFTPAEEQADRARILSNYCTAVQSCLPVTILSSDMPAKDEFIFKVNFIKDDGTVWRLGPCCGATEEEMPPVSEFSYTVKKIAGRWQVVTPPQYQP
jgi:hypothetical protein